MSEELQRILQEENLFKLLKLKTTATSEEIKTSYKKLMRQVHPDRFQDAAKKEQAEVAFKRLGLAFQTLKDPLARKDYERLLKKSGVILDDDPFHAKSGSSTSASPSTSKSTSSSSSSAPPNPIRKTAPFQRTEPSRSARPRTAKTAPFDEDDKKRKVREEQAEKHYQSGRGFESKNQMDDAVREYKEALRLANHVARYHSRLGLALDKKGWGGYAQAEFKVALHFDPTDSLALKHYQPTQGKNTRQGFKFLSFFKGNKSQRLGDILIELGYLDKSQLQQTLKLQQDEKLLLGELLIRKKFVKPEQLAQALIHQAELYEENDDKKDGKKS